jgi:hypothetical protein
MLGRAVPPTTAFQYVHDAANDATIIGSFDTAYVRRQVSFDPLHCSSLSQNRFLRMVPIPFQRRIRIVLSEQKN